MADCNYRSTYLGIHECAWMIATASCVVSMQGAAFSTIQSWQNAVRGCGAEVACMIIDRQRSYSFQLRVHHLPSAPTPSAILQGEYLSFEVHSHHELRLQCWRRRGGSHTGMEYLQGVQGLPERFPECFERSPLVAPRAQGNGRTYRRGNQGRCRRSISTS
jgi:hypothetical protein